MKTGEKDKQRTTRRHSEITQKYSNRFVMSGNRRENGTEETTKQQQHQNKNEMFSGFIRK